MILKSFQSIAFRLLLVFCFLLSVVSCTPAPIQWNWTGADLRLLDPVDDTPTPSTDILALYVRTISSDLEIRIDLLDIAIIPDYDLRLRLSTSRGDYITSIPATGQPVVNPAQAELQVRVVRDPWLDTVTVRFNRLAILQPFTLQVATFVPGSSIPADETVPVASDAPPPVARASLLLAFWNTFPVTTPAQALRRWDGAHSGPRGERHGLSHILEGSSQYHIPLALLDLKIPASLAALNFVSVMPQITALTDQGLLILPDVAYGEPGPVAVGFSRRSALGFGLPTSQFIYSTNNDIQSQYLAQFIPLMDASHLSRSADTRLIPLPAPADSQATADGPSLDVRKQLVEAALSDDASRLVVLGGDLPLSTWGNFDMAEPTFAWLGDHPWIHPLTGDDLLTFPFGARSNLPSAGNDHSSVETGNSPILAALRNAPNNSLTDLAWQTWFMLTAPTSDENLRTLRLNYMGQVNELLAAAIWAENPFERVDCSLDLNGDNEPECVLSNLYYFAILDPDGGRLSNLFYLDAAGPHQLIGPSSQFTVGLSDPSTWKFNLGEAADPSVIPGAFIDNNSLDRFRFFNITQNGVVFVSEDGHYKLYTLSSDGLDIIYGGKDFRTDVSIPLAVDPRAFYSSPINYQYSASPGVWTWGPINGIQVEVSSDAALSVQSFIDSHSFMPGPENPDQAYPPGHYLPLPLSVVTLQANGNFTVHIFVK